MNVRIECDQGVVVIDPGYQGAKPIRRAADVVTFTLVASNGDETDYRIIQSPAGAFLAVAEKRPAQP